MNKMMKITIFKASHVSNKMKNINNLRIFIKNYMRMIIIKFLKKFKKIILMNIIKNLKIKNKIIILNILNKFNNKINKLTKMNIPKIKIKGHSKMKKIINK
jgi:hypothetical protein